MALFQYFLPNDDINKLVQLLISKKYIFLCVQKELKINRDWLFENYNNELSEENLYNLIKVFNQQKCRNTILFFVDYANKDAISDRVFDALFEIKSPQFNNNLIVILSHKNLNERMLLQLCDTEKSFESYFELAILYYTNDLYEADVFLSFLERFFKSKFAYMHNELFDELSLKHTESNIKRKELKTMRIRGQSGDGSMIDTEKP